jgi:hypothetical protein
MTLKGFRVRPTGDGDKVTVLADVDEVRVITTIQRGVVDDVSPSKLATAEEREDFIKRHLDPVSRVIETKFRAGQLKPGGHGGNERFIELETADLQGLDLQ